MLTTRNGYSKMGHKNTDWQTLLDLVGKYDYSSSVNTSWRTNDNYYEYSLDLPGVLPDTLDLSTAGGYLYVKGTRKTYDTESAISYRLNVYESMDLSNIDATLEHGVLYLRIPKRVQESTKIAVKVK